MKALFIHRSVGRNLLRDGHVRELLGDRAQLDDYDNNTGILTSGDSSIASASMRMPGDNTNPNNLARFFSGELPEELAKIDLRDTILIKSCYPNSAIKSDDQLAQIQDHYRTIAASFASRPDQRLIILTSPPLRPGRTTPAEATRAKKLADWLVEEKLGLNVSVFDLHTQLSETDGPEAGMLRRDYRRFWPWDNHPNAQASRDIAPKLIDFLLAAEK